MNVPQVNKYTALFQNSHFIKISGCLLLLLFLLPFQKGLPMHSKLHEEKTVSMSPIYHSNRNWTTNLTTP